MFTVLFEDTAALLGLGIAFIGILASQALDMPALDGIASICIGLILGATAAFLAYECKGLLTGEGALTAAQVEGTVTSIEREVRPAYPQVDRVFIEAQSLGSHRQDRLTIS